VIASAERRSSSVRSLAAEILLKVDSKNAYADILLDQALRARAFDPRDRALLTEIVYGTLRWRGKIDAEMRRYLRRPVDRTDPLIRNLLRLTGYQLLFLDRIPDYAAVGEAVEIAKRHSGGKTAGFVNAVLRNFLRSKDHICVQPPQSQSAEALAIEYSHPEWLVKRWTQAYGQQTAMELMRANNDKSPLVLRVNSLRCTRAELLRRFLEAGISAAATKLSPQGISVDLAGAIEGFPGFAEGLFQVQAESSQLIGFLLSPLTGQRCLDVCAAPGGKATHIAEIMKERGEVVAIDKTAAGVEKLRQNAARLGTKSLQPYRADASRELSKPLRQPYDRVLVDAPCSGLGTLRSHPEIKWRRTEADIHRLSVVQAKILNQVTAYVKPGGVLVYATCTLAAEENEQVMESFLANHPEFEL
jgi:16S rRNA (cytosine967-C5)-methyltransferase